MAPDTTSQWQVLFPSQIYRCADLLVGIVLLKEEWWIVIGHSAWKYWKIKVSNIGVLNTRGLKEFKIIFQGNRLKTKLEVQRHNSHLYSPRNFMNWNM